MLGSLRGKPPQNEKHKQILDSLNDLENFNIDFSILSRADDSYDSNSVKMNETDIGMLKKNLLFKHWHNETLTKFIEEKHICLRKIRYKQVLANGLECQEKIFIVKSGEMLVWVKINKNHIRNYKIKLSKYHMKEKLPESNIKKAKTRFKRDKMVDINSVDQDPTVKRSESGFSEMSRTSIKTAEETAEIVKTEPMATHQIRPIRIRQSFSAVIKTVNDLNFPVPIRAITALPGKRTIYHFHNNVKENEHHQEKINETENQPEVKTVLKENAIHEKKTQFEKSIVEHVESEEESDEIEADLPTGLSDFLFDDTGEKDGSGDGSNGNKNKKFLESDDEDAKRNDDNEDAESENGKELNSKNLPNYYFISNARQLECYVIDKEYYLKNMQTFTEDKNIISKYLQTLRNECVRTPTNDLVDQLFVEQLDWNKHKEKIFNEQLKYRKKQAIHMPPSLVPATAPVISSSLVQNIKPKVSLQRSASLNVPSLRKKFHF